MTTTASEIESIIAERATRDALIAASRQPIIDALQAAGFYSTDSVGRKMAIKVYQLLQHIGKPANSKEMCLAELKLRNHLSLNSTDDYSLYSILELPEIFNGAQMKLTARRARIILCNAGLVTMNGQGPAARYSIATEEESKKAAERLAEKRKAEEYPKRVRLMVKPQSRYGVVPDYGIELMAHHYIVRDNGTRVIFSIFHDIDYDFKMLRGVIDESSAIQDPTDGAWCSATTRLVTEGTIGDINLLHTNQVCLMVELRKIVQREENRDIIFN